MCNFSNRYAHKRLIWEMSVCCARHDIKNISTNIFDNNINVLIIRLNEFQLFRQNSGLKQILNARFLRSQHRVTPITHLG